MMVVMKSSATVHFGTLTCIFPVHCYCSSVISAEIPLTASAFQMLNSFIAEAISLSIISRLPFLPHCFSYLYFEGLLPCRRCPFYLIVFHTFISKVCCRVGVVQVFPSSSSNIHIPHCQK